MTKKNFIALAKALKGLEISAPVLDALIRFCKQQNGRFMEQRFRDYLADIAGPNGGKIK